MKPTTPEILVVAPIRRMQYMNTQRRAHVAKRAIKPTTGRFLRLTTIAPHEYAKKGPCLQKCDKTNDRTISNINYHTRYHVFDTACLIEQSRLKLRLRTLCHVVRVNGMVSQYHPRADIGVYTSKH